MEGEMSLWKLFPTIKSCGSSCCQRLTIGTKHCLCFLPSSSSHNQSKMQNPCRAYCHATADPSVPGEDLPGGAAETCGEGWKRMNMKLLTSGQGFEFSGHCVETVSDSGLQKPMTLQSFCIQRCETGWADRDM